MADETETEETTEGGLRSQMWIHQGFVQWYNDEHGIDLNTMDASDIIAHFAARRNAYRRSQFYLDLKGGRADVVAAEKAAKAEAREAEKARKAEEREAAKAAKAAAKAEADAAKAEAAPAKKAAAPAKKAPAKKAAAKATKPGTEDPFS